MRPITRTRQGATAVIAGLGLVLALGACGGGDDPEDDGNDGDAGETAQGTGGTDAGAETGTDTDEATVTQEPAGPAAAEVAAAREGLASWLDENRPETPGTTSSSPDCPAIELERLEEALGAAGYPDTALGSWGSEIEWSEYEALHPDLMGIACGGDSDGDSNDSEFGTAAGVFAADLKDKTDFESFLAAGDITASQSVDPPEELGGELRTHCFDDGPEFCLAIWHEDGLVLGTSLIAEGADEDAAQDLLLDVLPDVLERLAEN